MARLSGKFGYIPPSRAWLTYKNEKQIKRFSMPVRGTHSECYQQLSQDLEVVPADGLDLALIVEGAFSEKQEWQKIRQENLSWNKGGVRMPLSFLISNIQGREGVLIEKEYQGEEIRKQMSIPDITPQWKEDEGVYSFTNRIWVPGYYISEPISEEDRLTRAVLTRQGAKIIARTAKDNSLLFYRWIPVVRKGQTLQRVGLLLECSVRLNVIFCYSGNRGSSAFGVQKETGEAGF